jgi:type I restriction enzyme M protein
MLAKWLDERYQLLWEAFGERPFRLDEATEVLRKKWLKENRREVAAALSGLRKAGLLHTTVDEADARSRWYQLKERPNVLAEIRSQPTALTRSEVDALLKRAADLIRTRVDYKFILVLLFLKRISDQWEIEFEREYRRALNDGIPEEAAREEAAASAFHEFDIPQEFLWDRIRENPAVLPERLSAALKGIADRNPELRDILENTDFIEFTRNRENAEILRQLVELFSERKLAQVSPDVLGDAYEWILHYFAPTKAKEGEIYTAREVIRLLIEILDPKPGESVYDPACGSGGMLIAAFKYVEKRYGLAEAQRMKLFGQEHSQRIVALARMNFYVHNIRDVNLQFGDSLLYPKFKESDGVKQFHIVVANPPWNQDGYGEEVLKNAEFFKRRFPFGYVPKQSADWAWIQHMLASALPEVGRVGVVIDNGALFRGGKEGGIREQAVKGNLLEAVVLLPEKLFYNTSAPGALLFFRRKKPAERKDKVLFIDASREFEKHPEVKKLNRLGEANIAKIRQAFADFKDQPGFTKVATLEEIAANDFNLSVPRYVESTEEEEQIDIAATWAHLQSLESQRAALVSKIEDFLKDLKS